MNKQTYLQELDRLLTLKKLDDVSDILSEYEMHFSCKQADGYTDEEIAASLGSPKKVAAQFTSENTNDRNGSAKRWLLVSGMIIPDIFAGSVLLIMYAWFVVLASTALAFALYAICLPLSPILPTAITQIPHMPYLGCIMMCFVCASLTALSAIAAMYSLALTNKLRKAYIQWHRNIFDSRKHPPVVIFPLLSAPKRRKLRNIILIASCVFAVLFITGYAYLALSAGSFEFWHIWNWFV